MSRPPRPSRRRRHFRRLAAMFVLAKAVAVGTLLFIDNAVAAEGWMLRIEAAQMMAAALPPDAEPMEGNDDVGLRLAP